MDHAQELILSTDDGVGRIRLNRPRALNALGMEMYRGLLATLTAWADDPDIRLVVIEGEGDRAFCAGGDIRALWEAKGRGDAAFMGEIFRVEYTMNRLINRFPKPYVALMDGITMGGGCGVSVHGSHRVVTERTLMAMPETGIGFFPDIGASWFLSRCPGGFGPYLGLTGARLGPADALATGLADAFIPSGDLDSLVGALLDGAPPDTAIAKFATDPGEGALNADRAAVERCFGKGSVPAILDALAKEEGAWARDTEDMLAAASPFSLAVSLEAIRRGKGASIEDCMTMEYRICRRFLEREEFFEGIRAAVIDKDRRPQWERDVPSNAVEACFQPLGTDDLRFD